MRSWRADVDGFFDEGQAHAAAYGAEYRALWVALRSAGEGGRRLRPALVADAFAAFGGTEPAVAERLGEAIELLHTAFVVHDDVIDHDVRRRGRLNVSGIFSHRAADAGARPAAATAYGQAAGILAGDLALVGAMAQLATVTTDTRVGARLVALVHEAVRTSAAGELDDVHLGLGTRVPTLEETLAVAAHKTAAYSFALPLQAGALAAGASEEDLAVVGRVGNRLGTAFQLCDDLLGVFGDEQVTGKSTVSDLREGKMTALIACAARTPAWPAVAAHLGDPQLGAAQAATLRTLLESCGARAAVERLVEQHVHAARELARTVGLDEVVERVTALAATHPGRAA